MKYLNLMIYTVIILFIMSGCSNQTYDNAIEKGIESIEKKNYSKAVSFFEIALEENKDSTEAKSYLEQATLLNTANDSFNKEDYEQALRAILKVEQLDDVHNLVKNNANDLKKQITQKQQQLVYKEELESIRSLIKSQEFERAEIKLETLRNLLADYPDFIEKLDETSQLLEEAKESEQVADENKEPEETPHLEQSDSFLYHTYSNGRYGFSVQYPTTFTEGQAPTNDDGREFYNEECTILAYGSLINIVAENETIEMYYNQKLAEVSNSVAYKSLGSNWYVISYKNGTNTIYQKAIINDGVIFSLQITYPSSQQHKYDPMVTHIANTFTPGGDS